MEFLHFFLNFLINSSRIETFFVLKFKILFILTNLSYVGLIVGFREKINIIIIYRCKKVCDKKIQGVKFLKAAKLKILYTKKYQVNMKNIVETWIFFVNN